MTKAELLALAARCEAAQGANRVLDAAIALAAGWQTKEAEGMTFWRRPGGAWTNAGGYPEFFTASIDAVASLAPEGWWCLAVSWLPYRNQWAAALETARGGDVVTGKAATEPLARCAAALRARAAEMEDEG